MATIPLLRKALLKVGLDGFLLGIFLMIILGYLWPKPGIYDGPFSLSSIANYGVSVIFFFYGLKLSPDKLKVGLTNWRLHISIQAFTFIIFPLIVLAVQPFTKETKWETLWLGTFYLAALPGTVSSAVVMVSIARGNLPAAIFNASISSLIGVFITPVWMGLFLTSSSVDYNVWTVMGKLVLQVLLPVLLGISLYSRLGKTAEQYKNQIKYFDQSIILIIVYTSFSESFSKKMFQHLGWLEVFLIIILMGALFFFVYVLIYGVSKLLNFNREDQITAIFCGSKKSLVQGTVMSKVLFTGMNSVGILLLPIMIYHGLQLIIASILAQSFARKLSERGNKTE